MAATALHGWVFDDRTGQAIIGANVDRILSSSGVVQATITTDGNGAWSWSGLTSAVYDVRVRYASKVIYYKEYGEPVSS